MYSSNDILQAIKRGDIIIEPFNLDQLNPNSYDVRLGNTFYLLQWDKNGAYYVGPYVYLDGEKVEVPVGGTLLGVTKEIIGTNGKVVPKLANKSTTRRTGFSVFCDAGFGDIGYCDYWTLELTAFINGNSKPYLIVGEKIAQFNFAECDSESIETYSGQYTSDWPLNMIPRAYRDRVVRPQN